MTFITRFSRINTTQSAVGLVVTAMEPSHN